MTSAKPRLAILGAGPIGLEAALAASGLGLPFTLYERGRAVGSHLRDWGHVRLFTPWSLSVSPRMRERLGLTLPEEVEPTGQELVDRVLGPLAELPEIAPHLRLDTRVVAVGRQGLLKHEEIATPARAARPFRLLVEASGGRRVDTAEVVLDCTGTWGQPNATGDGGIPAPGEDELGETIVRRIPDLLRDGASWAGRTTLLVGAGHSAQTAAQAFATLAGSAPGTRLIWVVKSDRPTWGRVENDPLPGRAALAEAADRMLAGEAPGVEVRPGAVVEAFARRRGRIGVTLRSPDGEVETVEADRVLSLTGSVGDHALYRQLQIHECYATCGPMKLSAALLGAVGGDCLEQTSHGAETLVNPEPGYFLLGAKSYGRNATFLLRVGWDQVREVIDLLD